MNEVVRLVAVATLLTACDRQPSSNAAPAAAATAPSPSTIVVSPPAVAASSASATATPQSAPPSAANTTVTFDADPIGAPAPEFESVIGDWYIAEDGGQRGLRVDGTKWQQGTPSASLADQAKRLYGDKYAEFIDGVKAFAFFPLAIFKSDPIRGDVRVSVRFYPESGRIDQGAGIAFDIAQDGSYQGVRANALEGNLLYFKVVHGKRDILENVRNVPTPTKVWHTLAAVIRGKHLVVEVDGQKKLERDLESAPAGRIGLWSKADSQVLMDDFVVKRL